MDVIWGYVLIMTLVWIVITATGLGALFIRLFWEGVTDRGDEPFTSSIPEPPYRHSIRSPQEYVGRREIETIMLAMSRKIYGFNDKYEKVDPEWYSVSEIVISNYIFWKLYKHRRHSLTKSQWDNIIPEGGQEFLLWLIHGYTLEGGNVVDIGPDGFAETKKNIQKGWMIPIPQVVKRDPWLLIKEVFRRFIKRG